MLLRPLTAVVIGYADKVFVHFEKCLPRSRVQGAVEAHETCATEIQQSLRPKRATGTDETRAVERRET